MRRYTNSFLIIMLVFTLLISLSSCNTVKPLSESEKVADFEQLYDVIKKGYPFLGVNKRVNGVDWLGNKEKYLNNIKNTKDDKEFMKALSESLADLNNGHTHLVTNKGDYDYLKKVFKDDGWYDFWDEEKVKARYDSLNTYKLRSVSTEDAKEVILKDVKKGEVGYIYLPQMNERGKSFDEQQDEFSKYLHQIKDYEALIIDIRGNGGGYDDYWMKLISGVIQQEYIYGGYVLFRSGNVIDNYIEKRQCVTRSIANLPEKVTKNCPKEVQNDFCSYVKISDIVQPIDSIKFKGQIFLLTDKSVYSSSESFAIFCKENKIATIIGETTGGDGGGYDPVLFKLNNSGLIVRMAEDMYLTPSGFCDDETKVVPDYEVENVKRTDNFKDDECIQKVLSLFQK